MNHTSVLFILLFCTTFSQTLDQEDLSDKILENSLHLPEFSWIDPLSIQVTFPGHGKDTINLRAAGRVADTLVRCLFNGNFENDIWGSAVVSGCIDDSSVFLTIYTTHLPGKTSFIWSQAGVADVVNPYAISGNETENIDDYGIEDDKIIDEVEKRVKRGTFNDDYYEDEYYEEEYYEEEYYDDSFDGPPPPPPTIPSDLILSVKLGYEESLLQQMNGNHSAAQAYSVEVASHGSIHMRHSSLGTRIHLQFIGPPQYLSGQTLKVDEDNLKKVQAAKTDSTPLIVFVKTDDDNATAMGVSYAGRKGGACDAVNSAAMLKWRSNPLHAAMTFAHENGHLTGQLHDQTEDKRILRNRGVSECEGTGIMSRGDANKERPAQWSECSARRFKKWFRRKGQCLVTVPSCDTDGSFRTPCTCGSGEDSMVCLSSHVYCWKKYFGDAPYQCLGSMDLEKALATPQRGDLAHDDDNISLPLVVERMLLKQAQQEKLIAKLLDQVDMEGSGAEVSSNEINSKHLINPSIEERISNQGKLMNKQERLIENLITQLDMTRNGTEVSPKEINLHEILNLSIEERVNNQENQTNNQEILIENLDKRVRFQEILTENLIGQLDMETNGTEVSSNKTNSNDVLNPFIEERVTNQEKLIENLINELDLERNGTEIISSEKYISKEAINSFVEESVRNQEELIDNLISQLDMERNGTEVLSNKINEDGLINPLIEGKINFLEKLIVLRTCNELEQSGVNISGYYHLDPDGINIGQPPIKVYCNFEDQVTEILHDNDNKMITIPHCDSNFCYKQEFIYSAHPDQIAALKQLSSFCDQSIEFNCKMAPLSQGDEPWGVWVDRNDEDQIYFHGANQGSHTCSCDSSKNCSGSRNTCNCDNAFWPGWMEDSGKLTNMTALPVKGFKYGQLYESQQAKFRIGRFRCGGRKEVNSVPRSCKDLKMLGETRPGLYYFQDENHGDHPKMSYCQLDQTGYGEGMESNSHWLKLSSGPGQVIFEVHHVGSITHRNVITFNKVVTNIGNGMDASTGVFTAPVAGLYDFKYSGSFSKSGGDLMQLTVLLNGAKKFYMATENTKNYWLSFSKTWVLSLQSGDKVELKKTSGIIETGNYRNFQFFGTLL